MFDLKVIQTVLTQLEEERGIPKEKVIEAIEAALATAYKKEYGKRGQIVRAEFNTETGEVDFTQVKIVVSPENVYLEEDEVPEYDDSVPEEDRKIRYNEEQHIFLNEAQIIKKGSELGEEVIFPLEVRDDYGRIAAQTAKQVIIQKIREAEKISVLEEYGEQESSIVSGTVERVERGTIFVDMGRAIGMLPYNEQIPRENFRQGERVRAFLVSVDETPKGVFLKLSRSHPLFLKELFVQEVPEINAGTVEIKAVAREAGARSKIAVYSHDDHVDPVGALVGQQGVRVQTVMSELHGEKIDIVEWSEDPEEFIEDSLSPAKIIEVVMNEEERSARVAVTEDQQSLAIGKGGQNARLSAKLTGWKIDIFQVDMDGNEVSREELDRQKEARFIPEEKATDSVDEILEEDEKTEEVEAPEEKNKEASEEIVEEKEVEDDKVEEEKEA
jgi:N utilization substance protein A